MSTISEIKEAIAHLSPREYSELLAELVPHADGECNLQTKADTEAGRLDFVDRRALVAAHDRIKELEDQLEACKLDEAALAAAQATLAEAAKYSPVLLEHARKLLDGWKKKVTASESRFRELAAKMLGKTSANPIHTEALRITPSLELDLHF